MGRGEGLGLGSEVVKWCLVRVRPWVVPWWVGAWWAGAQRTAAAQGLRRSASQCSVLRFGMDLKPKPKPITEIHGIGNRNRTEKPNYLLFGSVSVRFSVFGEKTPRLTSTLDSRQICLIMVSAKLVDTSIA